MRKQVVVIFLTLMCVFVAKGQQTQPNTAQPRPAVPYWDPNRKLNPNGPAKGDRRITTRDDFKFAIRSDAKVTDALGRVLGTIATGSRVQINKNAQRWIVGPNGKRELYELALGAPFKNPAGGTPVHASGFVRLKDINLNDRPAIDVAKIPKVKGPTTAYALTGGNPKDKSLGSYTNGNFVPYKFRDRQTGLGYTHSHRESTDYVTRPIAAQKSYVNILNKLPGKGGTAVSVIKIDPKHPVKFHRLDNVKPKTISLYKPGGTKAGSMTFVKGYINDPKTDKKVVGWVAKKALTPKPAAKKKAKH